MNFIHVKVDAIEGDSVTVSNAALDPVRVAHKGRVFTVGQTATLGVRPQDLSPAGEDGMLHGKVTLTERLGSETVVNLALKDGSQLIAALSEDAILEEGAEANFRFDPAQAHIFPEAE